MTKKQIKKLDDLIGYLSTNSDRIKIIRQTLGINTDYNFLREVEIIEYLFTSVLKLRKKLDNTVICASTSGWTVNYIRQHKKYKKDEDYSVSIYFSFVEADTYE